VGNYIEDCLTRKIVFFTGKGGVGKSTFAWATALACHRRGKRVAVASWDPFDIRTPGPTMPEPCREIPALKLETMGCFREFVLKRVRIEKLYDLVFDNYVLRTFLTTAPGVADTVIAGKLCHAVDTDEYDLLLVDLPSSGHTLSFFKSPFGVQMLFPVGFVHRESKNIGELFQSQKARIDFVLLPEELSVTETGELRKQLAAVAPLSFGYALVNAITPDFDLPDETPAPLAESASLYRDTRERERAALEEAAKLGLPLLQFSRFATEELGTAIVRLAEELEKR